MSAASFDLTPRPAFIHCSAPMSRRHYFQLWVTGAPTARSLRNIRRLLDMDIAMMDEAEALEAFDAFDPCI